MLAVRELTRYSNASGQEGSRAEKHGRSLSCLFGGGAKKKKGGGARWGIGRKRGKREEK